MEKTKARTSITIDDDVYEEAKRVAKANKVSFSSMVENSLRQTMQLPTKESTDDV